MVDVLTVAVEGGVAFLGGVGGVLAMTWRSAAKLQNMLDEIRELKRQLEDSRETTAKLGDEFDAFVRREQEVWQDINRTLGQIEGRMGGGPPPMRGKLPSRG